MQYPSPPPPPPVLIITDVGKDIDDTLALLYLAHLHQQRRIRLVGVVATGGRNHARARAACAILRSVHIPALLSLTAAKNKSESEEEWESGISGGGVPVVAGKPMSCPGEHVVHVEVDGINFNEQKQQQEQEEQEQELEENHHHHHHHHLSTSFIEHLLTRFAGSLRVVGLGPLTDLASSDLLRKPERFHSVYLQGQALHLHEPLLPSPEAFNFKCDMKAAEQVFASLAPHCPFILLGKFAAYTVGLTSQDFDSWDRLSHNRLNLKGTVMRAIAHLKSHSPDVYVRVFGHDDDKQPLSYLSRPYDPMLCVLLDHTTAHRFFDPMSLNHMGGGGGGGRRGGSNNHRRRHKLVGVSATNTRVICPEALHQQLVHGIGSSFTHYERCNALTKSCLLVAVGTLFGWTLYCGVLLKRR